MAKTEVHYFDVYLIWRLNRNRPAPVISCLLECVAAKDKAQAGAAALKLLAGDWIIVRVKEL